MNTLSASMGLSPDAIRAMSLAALIVQIEEDLLDDVVVEALKRDYGLPVESSAADLIMSLKDEARGLMECAP